MLPPAPAAQDTVARRLPDSADTARVLLAQQVAMHGSNVPWATAGSLLLGMLFVGLQWPVIAHGPLLAWAASLVVVMAWRGGLCLRQRRQGPGGPPDSRWLLHYRITFLAHGLVWTATPSAPTAPRASSCRTCRTSCAHR